MKEEKYLQTTNILNYNHPSIQKLIGEKHWKDLDEYNKIGEIYNFVRDDIKFGYNVRDDISASEVLKDGYGQCNTKGALFMALLRAVGIPCRLHGFAINKRLQKGAITGLFYMLTPDKVIHSWVELYHKGKWINM